MEDAERPRRMYLVAIAQHEIDVFQLNIAQHVHARQRWRREQRIVTVSGNSGQEPGFKGGGSMTSL